MGIQTMASQGGGGGVAQRSQIQSLQRQSSLYSLTLGEVQSHLGESLHSMNLEELLKGLDTNQEVNSPRTDPYASSSTLQRQGSYTLTQDLRAKTVEEVWRGIQDGNNKSIERQLTFGEMTLEEFLGRAGLVPEGIVKTRNNVVRNNVGGHGNVMSGGQGPHWLHQYHQQNMMGGYLAGRSVPQSLDGMYSEEQMSISSPTVGGAMSDLRTSVRKRGAVSDVADKLVERRQKRMIKNRESAARSRARKQAYTNELENKVSRLEEENERLKKQKELEMILLCAPPPEPKYQLRRTSSATF